MRKLALVLVIPLFALSATAHAHFNLVAPPQNNDDTAGGMGVPPCGEGGPSNVITPVQGGHALTIKIMETVAHTGFYRMALSINSESELPLDNVVTDSKGNILPPDGKPQGVSNTAAYENPAVFPVLADHQFVHTAAGAQPFQEDITLPNVTCAKCTLQVIEFMAGHGYNVTDPTTGLGGGYFYHHCADLKITADPALPAFVPPSSGGSGGASAGGASSSAGTGGVPSSSGGGASGGSPGQGGGGTSGTTPPNGGVGAGGGNGIGIGGEATAPTSSDSGGCSYSASRGPGTSSELVSLLLALFVIGRRRGRARAV